MSTLSVNGEPTTFDLPITVSAMLASLNYQAPKVAVAVNGEFVARSTYALHSLNEGDQVDIVMPIGGG